MFFKQQVLILFSLTLVKSYFSCQEKCNQVIEYVCDKDNSTHINLCFMQCQGGALHCQGKCPCQDNSVHNRVKDDEDCHDACADAGVDPVCGSNDQDYAKHCIAACEGVTIKCHGTCPCEEECIFCETFSDHRPVCSGNKTYESGCYAECDDQLMIKCRQRFQT